MATKYQDKSGCWYIKFKAPDGKWKSKNCGKNATATDAETIRKNFDSQELNRRHGVLVRMVNVDLQEQIKKFWEEEVPRSTNGQPKEESTIANYQAVLRNFEEWCKAKNYHTYADINKDRARDFIDYLIGLKRSGSNITKSRQLVTGFFSWSIEHAFCSSNPFGKLKSPRPEMKTPRYFTDGELVEIFGRARPPYDEIFRFLFLTGLRIGELCHLEWRDYMADQRIMIIRKMPGNKTKRETLIHLNADAVKIIEKRKAAITDGDSVQFVFVNMEDRQLDNANVYRHLKVILGEAKITGASTHVFRHTCASHLAIKGVSLYIIKDILRHKDIAETMIYAHLSRESVVNAIGQLHLPPKKKPRSTKT